MGYLSKARVTIRNYVTFLLSLRAGLLARQTVSLKPELVLDAGGRLAPEIPLVNETSKRERGGRIIPLSKDLRGALAELKTEAETWGL